MSEVRRHEILGGPAGRGYPYPIHLTTPSTGAVLK